MGTHIGNACHLQQALHGAVLAVFAVEHREYHIDPFPNHAVTLEAQKALAPDGGNGSPAVVRMVLPGAGGQQRVVVGLKEDPVTLLGDTHGEDIIFFRVQAVQHVFCRTQGHRMFRADTAKQNAHT